MVCIARRANDSSAEPSVTEALRSLEARYYTDPEIFKLEQQGVLARTWQFAGHVSALQEPGDYFTFEIAGENLFCVLTREHEVCLLYTSPSPRDGLLSRMPSSA